MRIRATALILTVVVGLAAASGTASAHTGRHHHEADGPSAAMCEKAEHRLKGLRKLIHRLDRKVDHLEADIDGGKLDEDELDAAHAAIKLLHRQIHHLEDVVDRLEDRIDARCD